jgi:outer membrane scaffolding protein for murein synthesis (MipA/OmpV family)
VGQSLFRCTALLIAAALAVPAAAQDKPGHRYRITAGAQVKPAWLGADDVSVQPLFNLDRARGDDPFEFEGPDDSFGFALVHVGPFEFGPAGALTSSRKPQDVGAAVPKVDRTVELGAFANLWAGEHVRLHAEVRRGVNGHEGWVGNAGADFIARDADKWLVSVGPRVTWADNNYHDAYFSVTPATALATGLPIYDAGSGVSAVGGAASVLTHLGGPWGLYAYGKYDRLVGDAQKSPIVRTYGSRDQFSAGVGISYTF